MFSRDSSGSSDVLGHVHGISFSGKREDVFPHALHMGALASAAGPHWGARPGLADTGNLGSRHELGAHVCSWRLGWRYR